jgi:hypothetical protein
MYVRKKPADILFRNEQAERVGDADVVIMDNFDGEKRSCVNNFVATYTDMRDYFRGVVTSNIDSPHFLRFAALAQRYVTVSLDFIYNVINNLGDKGSVVACRILHAVGSLNLARYSALLRTFVGRWFQMLARYDEQSVSQTFCAIVKFCFESNLYYFSKFWEITEAVIGWED